MGDSQGKRGAKFGRSSRSPSGKAYKNGNRWSVNKAKRITKDAKRIKDHQERRAYMLSCGAPAKGAKRALLRKIWVGGGQKTTWEKFKQWYDPSKASSDIRLMLNV